MHKFFAILFIVILINTVTAEETKYILHDKCINALYEPAIIYFKDSEIAVHRDSRGILLRFELRNPEKEYAELTEKTLQNLFKIEKFLAKNKNLAIIETHTVGFGSKVSGLKNWEVSAVIAGNLEKALKYKNNLLNSRIHSVGYGEFLPENNTSNNGGKLLNRVDIIILCNIGGE